jgi:hypothetical protein
MPAWGGDSGNTTASVSGLTAVMAAAGVFSLAFMIPTLCSLCFLFPIPIGVGGDLGPPEGINNGSGEVAVTVTHRRQGGGALKFWTMNYPTEIVSQAQAHYNEANISMGGDPGSAANLVSVL